MSFFKSIINLTEDVVDIATAPVKIVIDTTRAYTQLKQEHIKRLEEEIETLESAYNDAYVKQKELQERLEVVRKQRESYENDK